MTKNILIKSCLFIFTIFVLSCSFEPPAVSNLSVKRLKLETDKDNLVERLSVFLLYADENGREDYNSVLITHKQTGLFWQLNRDNSSYLISENINDSEKKKFWVGSNKIAYPFGKIPLGDYSIIIEDLSGRAIIKNIILKQESDLTQVPFTFTLKGKNWEVERLDDQYKNYSLILLGSDKQPIFVQGLSFLESKKITGNIDSILKEYSDARYIQFMAENSQKNFAYLTKTYKIY